MDMHSVISGIILAAMALGGTASDPWSGDGGAGPFYDWQAALPAQPGVLLRHEVAPVQDQLPQAAQSWRILYTSTDFRDAQRTVTVSGTVWVPRARHRAGDGP
jgi:hypothetical protein